VTTAEIEAPYDAILLAVKAYSLDAALDDITPAVGPQSMVVPVLNGIRHVDRIIERFGPAALIGGVCKVSTTLDEVGRIVQFAPFNELDYGEMNGAPSPRTQALHEFMQGAGFDAKLTPTVELEMWEKWLFLATIGATCCLMHGNIGEIGAAAGGPEFLHAVMNEVLAIITAAGHEPREEVVRTLRGILDAKGSLLAPSMYRDMQKGNAVEADQIVGDLLARGAALGVPSPLVSAAYTHLSIYQRRRATA
jgi:2-dehydropantoate 2-reductase